MKIIFSIIKLLAIIALLILAVIFIPRLLPFTLASGVIYDGSSNRLALNWSNQSEGAVFDGAAIALEENGQILFEADNYDISDYTSLTLDLTAMDEVQVTLWDGNSPPKQIDLDPFKRKKTIDLEKYLDHKSINRISIRSTPAQNIRLNEIRLSSKTTEDILATTEAQLAARALNNNNGPIYGIEYVPPSDYGLVKEFGVQVTLQDFRHDGTPEEWLALLDGAADEGIRLVAWQWPPGFSYNGDRWELSSQAELFIETVHNHPALYAVYGLHEPYWNGCFGCGYTTAELQELYLEIKNVADVPIFNDMDELELWANRSPETVIADGVCDYCGTWYYPAETDGSFDIRGMRARLESDLRIIEEHAPNSELFWAMQSFSTGEPFNKRMPTGEEMKEIAEVTFQYADRLGGIWWYPWQFDPNEYGDFLGNRSDLHPVLIEIYDDIVKPTQAR